MNLQEQPIKINLEIFVVDRLVYNFFYMQKQELVSPQDLIIIITTSPIKSNPVTEVIDMAIDSIRQQKTLAEVQIYIICDGVKVQEDAVNKYKSGIVSEESLKDYQTYKQSLKDKYGADKRIVIEERVERWCFAQNIRYVMAKTTQPFAMIFQHDHVFLREINHFHLIEQMKKNPINYIGFFNRSVRTIPHELDQNLILRKYIADKIGYQPDKVKHDHDVFIKQVISYYEQTYSLPLMPLLFWYDKVHIARRSYYLDVIFSPHGFYDQVKKTWQKTVSFVQDSYGTVTKKNIRKRPEKIDEVGAFILWDSPEPAIQHSHGRFFITQQTKQQLYLKHLKPKEDSGSSDSEQQSYDLSMLNNFDVNLNE